jgi:hypothetical protein
MLIPISYFGRKIGFGILALRHRCNVQQMSRCSISPRFSKADPLLSIPIYCIPTPISLNLRYMMRVVKRLPPRKPLSNIRIHNFHKLRPPLPIQPIIQRIITLPRIIPLKLRNPVLHKFNQEAMMHEHYLGNSDRVPFGPVVESGQDRRSIPCIATISFGTLDMYAQAFSFPCILCGCKAFGTPFTLHVSTTPPTQTCASRMDLSSRDSYHCRWRGRVQGACPTLFMALLGRRHIGSTPMKFRYQYRRKT